MGAMLCDVVIAGGTGTYPRSMPLAMLTMKKQLHGFLFLRMHLVLLIAMLHRLVALWAAGAPLKARST